MGVPVPVVRLSGSTAVQEELTTHSVAYGADVFSPNCLQGNFVGGELVVLNKSDMLSGAALDRQTYGPSSSYSQLTPVESLSSTSTLYITATDHAGDAVDVFSTSVVHVGTLPVTRVPVPRRSALLRMPHNSTRISWTQVTAEYRTRSGTAATSGSRSAMAVTRLVQALCSHARVTKKFEPRTCSSSAGTNLVLSNGADSLLSGCDVGLRRERVHRLRILVSV